MFQEVRAQDPIPAQVHHNEFLTYPNKYDQIFFASVKQAREHGSDRGRRDDLFRLRRIGAAGSSR